jgi:hypothetical protein
MKLNRFAVLLVAALLLGVALTQESGEDFSEVVVVYENKKDDPNASETDTYTFDAEFWEGFVRNWLWPDFSKGLTPDGGGAGGDGGQQPEPDCDQLFLDFWERVGMLNDSAKSAADLLDGSKTYYDSVGHPLSAEGNRNAAIKHFAVMGLRRVQMGEIFAKMKEMNCPNLPSS